MKPLPSRQLARLPCSHATATHHKATACSGRDQRPHSRARPVAVNPRTGRRLGFASTNTVSDYLGVLTRKGYITREPGGQRTVQIVGETWLVLPLVGEFEDGRLTAIEDENVDFGFLFGGA